MEQKTCGTADENFDMVSKMFDAFPPIFYSKFLFPKYSTQSVYYIILKYFEGGTFKNHNRA